MYWAPTLKWEWLNSNFGILSYPPNYGWIQSKFYRKYQLYEDNLEDHIIPHEAY